MAFIESVSISGHCHWLRFTLRLSKLRAKRVALKLFEGGSCFRRNRTALARMSVDKDMSVPPDDARRIAIFLENRNLVGDGTGSELGHSETKVEHCGE